MGILDILLLAAVGVLLWLALRSLRKNGGCGSCRACGGCDNGCCGMKDRCTGHTVKRSKGAAARYLRGIARGKGA